MGGVRVFRFRFDRRIRVDNAQNTFDLLIVNGKKERQKTNKKRTNKKKKKRKGQLNGNRVDLYIDERIFKATKLA